MYVYICNWSGKKGDKKKSVYILSDENKFRHKKKKTLLLVLTQRGKSIFCGALKKKRKTIERFSLCFIGGIKGGGKFFFQFFTFLILFFFSLFFPFDFNAVLHTKIYIKNLSLLKFLNPYLVTLSSFRQTLPPILTSRHLPPSRPPPPRMLVVPCQP